MNIESIFIFCVVSEIVESYHLEDDPQCKMSSSEVITFTVISSLYYQCNYQTTHLVCKNYKLFPNILSHSRLIRRIHLIPEALWFIIFEICRNMLTSSSNREFIIDSFPVAACQTHKSFRCKLFGAKEYHGYTASKKHYFFGIKVHMISDAQGIPIEFLFTEGSKSDVGTLKGFNFCLPEGSVIYADRAYTNYQFEDLLQKQMDIQLLAKRKSNAKRQHDPGMEKEISAKRNRIETTFSAIISLMPRHIQARTRKGFLLKVLFFILGFLFKRVIV